MGNARTNVYAKFRRAALHVKKVLGLYRELITTRGTKTTRVAFGDLTFGSKNWHTITQNKPKYGELTV